MSNRTVVIGNLFLSAGLYGFLMWLIYAFELDSHHGDGLLWLPGFNAACNAVSASAVALGMVAIKRQRKTTHAVTMIFATAASALFLAGYLVHHTIHGDTRYLGQGLLRPLYFTILITHILMSAIALPLILNTLSFAALRRFQAHRRVGRWTYPIWLYVSVTGVAVWFFLRVLNPVA